MSIFKAYKGHKKIALQVEEIIHSHGNYLSITELLTEVPTEILTDWLIRNGIEPNHTTPKEIQGVFDELTFYDTSLLLTKRSSK